MKTTKKNSNETNAAVNWINSSTWKSCNESRDAVDATKWSTPTQLLWTVAFVWSLRCVKESQQQPEKEEEEEEALFSPTFWLVGSMAPDKGVNAAFRCDDGDENVRDSSESTANGSSRTGAGCFNWSQFKISGKLGLLVRRSPAATSATVVRPY